MQSLLGFFETEMAGESSVLSSQGRGRVILLIIVLLIFFLKYFILFIYLM
jgi:hypothetical protein